MKWVIHHAVNLVVIEFHLFIVFTLLCIDVLFATGFLMIAGFELLR